MVIVFKEGRDDAFVPSTKHSTSSASPHYTLTRLLGSFCFLEIYIVVQELQLNEDIYYRVQIATKLGIEPFPPFLPDPPVFVRGDTFKNFFLNKGQPFPSAPPSILSHPGFSCLCYPSSGGLITRGHAQPRGPPSKRDRPLHWATMKNSVPEAGSKHRGLAMTP